MSAHIMMTESSVIRHYKKQLIHRQHDLPDREEHIKIDQNGIYDFVDNEIKNDKVINVNNGKKTRKKRKNRNCRGQFRHEGMELIKLGTNTTHSLCKTKEPYNNNNNTRIEKTFEIPAKKEDQLVKTPTSVIQSTFNEKTIILENHPQTKPALQPYGHSLPQMVPERRNSKEMNPPIKPPLSERRDSLTPPKVPYSSPPRLPPPVDYRVPIHPTPSHYLSSFPQPHYRNPLPPPPYTAPCSPPLRPIARNPIQSQHRSAFHPPPYPNIQHFPYTRHHHYSNGYPNPPQPLRHEFGECRKRKHSLEGDVNKISKKLPAPSVVAAIDLTMDQEKKEPTVGKRHKCHCECGKTYTSDPVTQEVIITVAGSDKEAQASSINLRGKLVDGILKLDKGAEQKPINGTTLEKKESPKVPGKPSPEAKLPQLFLIKDLLAKGVRVEKKSSHHRIEEEVLKSSQPTVISPKEKPRISEPHRVIVSANDYRKAEESPKTHTVTNMIDKNRRQSVDIDTISISSGSSESLRSPRSKPNGIDKQVPQGKLFYYKTNNSFIRYFEDTQKKLFFDNLIADGKGFEMKRGEDKEVIELPKNMVFSSKDNLTVEEYVNEMTLAEKFIPKDFFAFYKFVTGYQICHNHLPVSFLTFLKVYNTNGLKDLLERYVASLKQAS